MQGPRHDMFIAGFTIWKFMFNIIDATIYMNKYYGLIDKFVQGWKNTDFEDLFD